MADCKITIEIDAKQALKFFQAGMEEMFICMSEFNELEEISNIYKIDLNNDEHSNG